MFSGTNPPVATRRSASETSANGATSPADGGDAAAWCGLAEKDRQLGGGAPATALPGGFSG